MKPKNLQGKKVSINPPSYMYSRNQMHTSEVASDAVSVFKNSVQIDITMNAVALLVFLLQYTIIT